MLLKADIAPGVCPASSVFNLKSRTEIAEDSGDSESELLVEDEANEEEVSEPPDSLVDVTIELDCCGSEDV